MIRVNDLIGDALSQLADMANCVSGDFHTMHLNFRGAEFDDLHKKVLQEYYEQSADDYDTWAEASLMWNDQIANQNEAAVRIAYQSYEGQSTDKAAAVQRTAWILQTYLENMNKVFGALNNNSECFKCVGVANTLQTRIEYWSKELVYFNARRM